PLFAPQEVRAHVWYHHFFLSIRWHTPSTCRFRMSGRSSTGYSCRNDSAVESSRSSPMPLVSAPDSGWPQEPGPRDHPRIAHHDGEKSRGYAHRDFAATPGEPSRDHEHHEPERLVDDLDQQQRRHGHWKVQAQTRSR